MSGTDMTDRSKNDNKRLIHKQNIVLDGYSDTTRENNTRFWAVLNVDLSDDNIEQIFL
jgi:hypothetical protein